MLNIHFTTYCPVESVHLNLPVNQTKMMTKMQVTRKLKRSAFTFNVMLLNVASEAIRVVPNRGEALGIWCENYCKTFKLSIDKLSGCSVPIL